MSRIVRSLALGVATAVLVLGAAADTSAAAQLTVTTTADSLSADGQCSLREALAAVNTPGSLGDCGMADDISNTIVLGSHEYDLTIHPSGADDQSTGDLDVNAGSPPLTIEGAGEGATTIGGAGLEDRVLHVLAGATVTVRDLTITGGHAPNGANGTDGSTFPTMTPATGGEPGSPGGGIRNAGSLTLERVAVTKNSAGSGGKGGNGQPGAFSGEGKAGGAGGAGGGIYDESPGSLRLTDATVSGNLAGDGGNGGNGGPNGTSVGSKGGDGGCCGDGGGLDDVGGQVVVAGTTFSGNRAGDGGSGGAGQQPTSGIGGAGGQGQGGSSGGAIAVSGAAATVSIANSTLSGNVSGAGGDGGNGGPTNDEPILDYPSGGGAGNGSAGGGLFVSAGATVTLSNATVAENQVGGPGSPGAAAAGSPHALPGNPGNPAFGGGVYDATTPATTLTDTLLASNELGNCAGNITDGGHNLSFGASDCPGNGFNRGDPRLGSLADRGGPTETQALGAGSAAIDAGAGCQPADQRGLPRPAGPACDIGAYEVTPPIVTTPSVGAITATGATLSASVTPNAGSAGAAFEFGTTLSYGSTTAMQSLAGGLEPLTVSSTLSGLEPGTTYHLRLTATSPDGTARSTDATFETTAERPRLRHLKVVPATVGPKGAKVTYSDSEAARTKFEVLRKVPGKHRLVALGAFSHADSAGPDSFRLPLRVAHRKLEPGRYALRATPRNASGKGPTASAGFKVQRRGPSS